MAWCHQATSHYLSQCWARSMASLGHNELRPVYSIMVISCHITCKASLWSWYKITWLEVENMLSTCHVVLLYTSELPCPARYYLFDILPENLLGYLQGKLRAWPIKFHWTLWICVIDNWNKASLKNLKSGHDKNVSATIHIDMIWKENSLSAAFSNMLKQGPKSAEHIRWMGRIGVSWCPAENHYFEYLCHRGINTVKPIDTYMHQ